jgi:hypothetical protein
MAKNKRRNAIGESWISYSRSMLESPALRVLSQAAIRVMHRIEIEHMHHGGAENGRLVVTYDQFEEYGVYCHAISPALRELVVLGFLEVTEKGCGGNENHRRANRFRLTYVNMKSREQPTHEWRHIATIDEAERLVRQARGNRDQRAIEIGRRSGRGRGQKQNPGMETVPSFGVGNHTQGATSPGMETVPTRPGMETVPTIYNLGGESIPQSSATPQPHPPPQ